MINQYEINIPQSVIRHIYDLKDTTNSSSRSGINAWQSRQYPDLKSIPWAKDLFDIVLETANLKNPLKHLWFNVSPTGGQHRWHFHGNCEVVGVLYIQVPENSGNIEFRGKIEQSITPYNGLLLIFPGGVDHRVLENKSLNDRITMAFNLGPLA